MKAAVVESPGKLVVRDIPKPKAAGEYDALCQLLYGATCTGTDQHLIHGDPPFCHWVQYPLVLGHESIGRVLEVGPKVRHLKVGDLVTRVGTPAVDGLHLGWGGFTQFGVAKDWRAMRDDGLPEAQWRASRINLPLPPDADPAAATMVITWRETYSYITRLGAGPGKAVLILGSGGNGLAFAAHVRNLGVSHCVMIGAEGRRDIALRAGATHVIDYKSTDVQQQAAAVLPDGFDLVIDAVGKAGLADLGLSLLRPGGTMGIYGFDDAAALRLNPSVARGTFTLYKGGYDEAEAHDAVVAAMRAGRLDASVWLDLAQPFALDRISDAFDAVKQRRLIKALIAL